jgi:hypothetical protein
VVTLNSDGSFSYSTTNPNDNGPDSFTYRLTGTGTTDETATVWLTVRPVNDAPTAAGDTYYFQFHSPLAVPAMGARGTTPTSKAAPCTRSC